MKWQGHRLEKCDFTSSFRFSSSCFSFSSLLSRSRSSKEKGQTSTRCFSGSRGWKGRPKWGTGGALIGDGGFTWQDKKKRNNTTPGLGHVHDMAVVEELLLKSWRQPNASLLPQPSPHGPCSWGQKLETLAQLAAELSSLELPVDRGNLNSHMEMTV